MPDRRLAAAALGIGIGAAALILLARARPAPPPPEAPGGELGLELEIVASPASPALVKATIRVRATAGTTPISADGTLVVPAIGRSVTWHVDITELGVWYEVVDTFDVPPGVTVTVTVSGTLSNPYGTYDLPSVSK